MEVTHSCFRASRGKIVIQYHKFEGADAGFVLHKIQLSGGAGSYSAWFDSKGKLLDAEMRTANLRTRTVTKISHPHVCRALENIAERYVGK
jgi:hypothetical protein